jgi:hypothetical protein
VQATPTGPTRKQLRHYPQVKIRNFQWQKLDKAKTDKTIWMLDGVKEDEIEDLLDADGVFSQIEELFPVKANTVFEEKMRQRQKEHKDAVRFLSKDKSRNISKCCFKVVAAENCTLNHFLRPGYFAKDQEYAIFRSATKDYAS